MAKKELKTKKTEVSEAPKKEKAPAEAKKTTEKKVIQASEKTSSAKKSTKTPTTMEELLVATGYALKAPKRGEALQGLITDISKKMVLVDIGAKTEGMVVDKEYEAARDLVSDMKVGDTITVFVVSPENDRGQILLSLKRAAMERKWEQFNETMETNESIEVKGIEVNRGGLIVQVDGIRGFVPSSQFSKDYLGKMEKLINSSFKVKVIEVDREKNRLIFSERHVSEAAAMAQKGQALKIVKEGDAYDGVVSGIMPFGVFITVEVPLKGKGTADDAAKPAKKTAKKSSASTDKTASAPSTSEVGQLEGLVHISEISWEKVDDPNDYFKIGDRISVVVLGVNEDNGKLNLSVKRLKADPWSDIDKRYGVGSKMKGKVTRVAPFGVFVTLEPGVDGLIHISKIPTGQEFKVGESVDVYVESVDGEHRRMSLGVVLTEVPMGYK